MTFSTSTTIPADPSDQQLVDAFMPLYVADRDRFMRAVTRVKQLNRHTRPLFPEGVNVASIAPVPPAELETFKAQHINSDYIKWGSELARERTKSNGRPVQYLRWRWAVENIETYVNMLRVYGHSDETIERMFTGVPMCFKSRKDFDDLRAALRDLSGDLAKEMGWANVGFVFTGSSVPGFSQNPLKGFEGIPSKITDPNKSDVDVCIVADGVNATIAELRSEGGEDNEPKWAFPTTINEIASGMRFGCKDVSKFSKVVGDFHKKWSEILPGGLQLTFCEDDTDIPPWESRIDIRNV